MASRLEEPEFRLLASVYAALGPDAFSGRYKNIADLMAPNATSNAVYCFIKRYVAPAAQHLKASHPDMQPSNPEISQQESGSSDRLLSQQCAKNFTKSQPESFRYKSDRSVYRCMLCLRQFDSVSSLTSHESWSEMHQSNLENPILVAQGRSRLAKILRSTANGLVDIWINNEPMSIAALIECLQGLESTAAS